MTRRKGFLLVETLIVMMIFGVMAGTLCVRLGAGGDDARVVRAEAEALADWLSGKMTMALLRGLALSLKRRI